MNQLLNATLPRPSEIEDMLQKIGVNTLDELVTQTIPATYV